LLSGLEKEACTPPPAGTSIILLSTLLISKEFDPAGFLFKDMEKEKPQGLNGSWGTSFFMPADFAFLSFRVLRRPRAGGHGPNATRLIP
jgi:hypothetical protein